MKLGRLLGPEQQADGALLLSFACFLQQTPTLSSQRRFTKPVFLLSVLLKERGDFFFQASSLLAATMPNTNLCLEALSALSGCNVESTSGASQFTPQDFVNIVALKQFYKQEGYKELEYPSLGTLSLQAVDDDVDLYSAPLALTEGPGPQESLRATVRINPEDFFHPQYDYDFTNIKVSSETHNPHQC